MTPEREQINTVWIPEFAKLLPKKAFVYDIGKGVYDYQEFMPNATIKTIDRNKKLKADFILDLEDGFIDLPGADGIICIGITEQCMNPLKVVCAIHSMLFDKGIAFFSVLLTGYPVYEEDYNRFTERGALRLLNTYFEPIRFDIYKRETPSCLFYLGRGK